MVEGLRTVRTLNYPYSHVEGYYEKTKIMNTSVLHVSNGEVGSKSCGVSRNAFKNVYDAKSRTLLVVHEKNCK